MKFFRWLKILLLAYALIGIAAYYLQDYFLFHPEPLTKSAKFDFDYPHREVNIPFDAGSNLNIVQFMPDSSRAAAPVKGVVLYLHGNKKNINWYARQVPAFTGRGYELWMIDYPGFGKSTGPLTEERMYAYAEQLYRLARAKYSADSITIYGKSMGTGIAAWLASRSSCKQLILETPYYSLRSLVQRYLPVYPVSRMIRYNFPTWEFLPKVVAPVVIFHGTEDGVIPYSNAARLQPLLKPADKFITIADGSHNDLPEYEGYKKGLDSVLGF
ncbi:alpha/beta hydrolase [Flavihumibacter stibioxidans]|uniref:AB hydrolase-1 domain-containing protein n=1 Tax=Flavihumibacter stibioxidans TaxID=1834163 RepID=A0ABR7MDB0_9BACT|nr:alpha/beta fold hydrolase [Flavihumibacter stibioxidans]MBC6493008.1 hypothetical protein [Flavihumibacter stibioxidans]